MARNRFPVTREVLRTTALKVARLSAREGNSEAEKITSADKWVRLFLERNPEIVLRTPEHVSSGQASLTKTDAREHFVEVKSLSAEKRIEAVLQDPRRIFNTDESGFALNPQQGRVLAERGSRNVASHGGSEKNRVTILVTGSAMGALAPTAILPR